MFAIATGVVNGSTRKSAKAVICMTAPAPQTIRRGTYPRSVKRMKTSTVNTAVSTNDADWRATLAAWLCEPTVLRM